MTFWLRNLREDATYWPVAGNDGYGGSTFGPPEPRKVRWQDMAVLFRDAEGREVTSSAVVYVNLPCPVGGYLLRGTSSEALPIEGALEVRQTGKSPNLGQSAELDKVFL